MKTARSIAAIIAAFGITNAFAAGNVVEFTYDAAGNITNISRPGASALAITGFNPTSGPEGTAVTITGAGFSATPANNGVTFNGTAASVSASSTGSITTAVPTGATTGPISVTVGGTTVSSSASFTVTPGAPTITGFTPASGAAGVSVAVTGTNFNTSATTVALNGVTAGSSVGSTTALSFTVPSSVSSGRISATTSVGTGASPTDFIVPPSGLTVSSIENWIRITADAGNQNISITTAGKSALVLFDGSANQYYSLQFDTFTTDPMGASINYVVVKPDNTTLISGTILTTSVPTLHLPKLPTTGTYTLQLTPTAGMANLNTNIRLDTAATIVVDGSAATLSQNMPNQSTRYQFAATAGQRIGLGVAGLVASPSGSGTPFNLYKPDGTNFAGGTCHTVSSNGSGDCGIEFVAPVSGTYLVTVDSAGNTFASASAVQLTSDTTGTLSSDVGQTVTLTRAGQSAIYTFTANSGDSFGVDVSGASLTPQSNYINVVVQRPDGSTVTSCSQQPPVNVYCELGTLSTAGTYTVLASVTNGMYGTFKLTLKQGPLLQPTDPPTAFAPANVSETARVRFAATAGQNYAVGVSSLAYVGSGGSSTLNLYTPSAGYIAANNCNPAWTGDVCQVLVTNASGGTYAAVVLPAPGVQISGNIAVSTDLTGTLTAGTAQSVTVSRVGQRALYSFAGTTGDSTSLKLFALTTTPANQTLTMEVDKPDGSFLASVSPWTLGPGIINLASLPVTGTYTVKVTSSSGYTWQGSLELDPGTAMSIDGSTITLSNTTAGEPIRYTFAGTSGNRLDFGIAGLTYGAGSGNTGVTIYRPDNNQLASFSCGTGSGGTCDDGLGVLPLTGTYAVIFAPPYNATLTGGTLALSTPLAGTIVIGDPAETIAITRPGQTARYTFSGTAAQNLHIAWTSVTVSGTSSYVAVTILNPDGSTLTTGLSMLDGQNGGFDIATLPTTGTYTVFLDPHSASTMSASVSLVTR